MFRSNPTAGYQGYQPDISRISVPSGYYELSPIGRSLCSWSILDQYFPKHFSLFQGKLRASMTVNENVKYNFTITGVAKNVVALSSSQTWIKIKRGSPALSGL